MSTPVNNNPPTVDSVLLSFNSALNSMKTKLSSLEAMTDISLTTADTANQDIAILKEEILALRESVGNIVSTSPTLASSAYLVETKKPSLSAQIAATLLALVAIVAIVIFVTCVVAVCGGFPLFLSILNLFTIGASVSLPLLGCSSVLIASLSLAAVRQLMASTLSFRPLTSPIIS